MNNTMIGNQDSTTNDNQHSTTNENQDSLIDITWAWILACRPANRRPNNFKRTKLAKALIAAGGIWTTRQGWYGRTWVSPELAREYAIYLGTPAKEHEQSTTKPAQAAHQAGHQRAIGAPIRDQNSLLEDGEAVPPRHPGRRHAGDGGA